MKKIVKIAITGAAGQVSYALLFRLAAGAVFGQETGMTLNLLDVKEAVPALEGVAMELEDCGFPLIKNINVCTAPQEAFKDIDWAILVGGAPRQDGMSRADLLKTNAKIFVEQGKALSAAAKPSTRVLVVANPCNTNAYIVKTMAANIPASNIFAMTLLDQRRAEAQLAKKAGVEIGEVTRLAVWGNHSATQFPDFYHARIGGRDATQIIKDENWLKNTFLETVQKRGAAIIKKRGKSSAASAANAVVETIQALLCPTPPQKDFFSVAVCSDGSYGVPEGLIFSFPVQSDGKKWHIAQGLSPNDFAQKKIQQTQEELLAEKETVEKEFLR